MKIQLLSAGLLGSITFLLCAQEFPEASDLIRTAAPGTVFTENTSPAFSLRKEGYLPACFSISDWRGNRVDSGLWASGELVLKKRLPKGYYKLRLETPKLKGERSFLIVADPEKRAGVVNDFYALDSGQANNGNDFTEGYGGKDPVKMMADLTVLAGIRHVRNRYYWGAYNPKRGVFDRKNALSRSMDLLTERGIHDSVLFSGSPHWARTRSRMLPDNLLDLYNVMKHLVADHQENRAYWEFWNEPDIGSAPEPVWHFAACQKAAYLGIKAGDRRAPVLNGALSGLNGYYEKVLFQNGIADYIDIFNVHTYTAPVNYPAFIRSVRECLKAAGAERLRIHVTETSCNAEGAAEESVKYINRHRTKGRIVRMGKHSARQEMLMAEYYPKSMLAFQREGVDRVYFFYFSPYNERNGTKDWGIMRRDASAKPVYGAIANMTDLLADSVYRGTVDLGKKISAHLLTRKDGRDVLVFWSRSPLDTNFAHAPVSKTEDLFETEFDLPALSGTYRLIDLFGKEELLHSPKKLKATRYPTYLTGKLKLNLLQKPEPKGEYARPVSAKDLSVVLDVYVNPADFKVTRHKTVASMPGKNGRLTLKVWNLSPEQKHGSLTFRNGTLSGIPGSMELQPFSCRTFEGVFTPSPGKETDLDFVIGGTFNGKEISILTLPVQVEERVFSDCISKPLDTGNLKRWRNNAGGPMKISFCPEEKCIRFDTDFTGGKPGWSYPEYLLGKGESLKDAVMLSFEIRSTQDKVENHFGHAGVYLVTGTTHERGEGTYLSYLPPIHDWEERRIILTGLTFPIERTGLIRIGGNPSGNRLTIYLRNVRVHYKKKQP